MMLQPKKRYIVQFQNPDGTTCWLAKWDGFRFKMGDSAATAYQFCWIDSAKRVSRVIAEKFNPVRDFKIFEVQLTARGGHRLEFVE